MQRSSSQAVLLPVPLLLLQLLLLHPAACQQTMPFPGNGVEPNEPVTVFVSSYIDRLMEIDDKAYEFQVRHWSRNCWRVTTAAEPGPAWGWVPSGRHCQSVSQHPHQATSRRALPTVYAGSGLCVPQLDRPSSEADGGRKPRQAGSQ